MAQHEIVFDVDGIIRTFRDTHPGIPENAEVVYVPAGKYPAHISFRWGTPETPSPVRKPIPCSKLAAVREQEANE